MLWLLTLFLLTRFSATGEVVCACRPPEVPYAQHADELTLAPVVEVRQGALRFDGAEVAQSALALLVAKADQFLLLPRQSRPTTVLIVAERTEPFRSVWPAMAAGIRSGAKTLSLLVLTDAP